MRFESLLWTALAMLLMGGAGWNTDSLVGGSRDYQATDGTSQVPPPIMAPDVKVPASTNTSAK